MSSDQVAARRVRPGAVPRERRRRVPGTGPLVAHIGVAPGLPGGISQVLDHYVGWSTDDLAVARMASTDGSGRGADLRLLTGCIVRLVVAASRRRPVAVVVHLSQRGSFVREGLLVLLVRLLGVPVAVHLHGSGFAAFAEACPGLVGRVLRAADRVYVLTEGTRDVVGRHRRDSAGVRLVRNAVGVPAAVGTRRSPVVLFGGELGARKGIATLLAAWTTVAAEHPTWRLVVAGPGPDGAPAPGVTFLGPVRHAAMLDLQAEAAIAVLPSRAEQLPLFLLESMARGCAVVGTAVGGVPDLVAGGAGVLVPVDDVAALARTLCELIADEPRRLEMGRAARRRVHETYSDEVVAAELRSEWCSLLRRTPP